jgi:hypothetical protein
MLLPGQEKHLPHEAWHVVQQKQGRVKPTMQMKDKVNVNDDEVLEREADVMGGKSIELGKLAPIHSNFKQPHSLNGGAVQLNGLTQEEYIELAGAALKIIQNSIAHVASARGASITIELIKDMVLNFLGVGTIFDLAKLAYYFLTGDTASAKEALLSILVSLTGLEDIKKFIDGLIELDGGDGRNILIKTKAYKKLIGKLD